MGFFSSVASLVTRNPIKIYRSGMAIASLADIIKSERRGEINITDLSLDGMEIVAEELPYHGVHVIDDALSRIDTTPQEAISKLRRLQTGLDRPRLGLEVREQLIRSRRQP